MLWKASKWAIILRLPTCRSDAGIPQGGTISPRVLFRVFAGSPREIARLGSGVSIGFQTLAFMAGNAWSKNAEAPLFSWG
jgi:hypothetical protein